MASIELLSSEPDLLVQIFLYLDLADLTSIEDVCTEWRDLGNLLLLLLFYIFFFKFSYVRESMEEKIEIERKMLKLEISSEKS